jgi:hypothetical protein
MKKVLKISAIVIVLLLALGFAYISYTSTLSPEAVVENTHNGFNVKATYCQPSVKGRKIFGELVPYGEVWRTGANAATVIHLGQDVTVAGKPLAKGDYTLWTIPGPNGWTAIFNKETGQWGTNYDETQDVLRVPVASGPHAPAAEQFTISFKPAENGTDMILAWDQTQATVPFRK